MQHLETVMHELLGLLDDRTHENVIRNKTVAIGLVVDDDGQQTVVYTVSGNWTNDQLRAAAKKVGIQRWETQPRAAGRGAVGAPADAEQLMVEAAGEANFTIGGMAVSRAVCPDCKEELSSYEHGPIRVIEVKVPSRSGSGGRGGGSKAAGGEGEVDVEGTPPAKRTASTAATEGPADMGPSPAATIVGVVGSFAAGIAVNLLSSAFAEKVESDLAKLPRPTISAQSAKSFLTDPNTGGSIQLLDAISRDIRPFGRQLKDQHANVMAVSQLNLMAVGASTLNSKQRLDYLAPLIEQLEDYDGQLSTIGDNLDAILKQKQTGLKTAKACDDLRAILHSAYMEQHWMETGFSVDAHEDVDSNLSNLAVTIRMAFSDAQDFRELISKLAAEETAMRQAYSAAYGKEFGEVVQAIMKKKKVSAAKSPSSAGGVPRASLDALRKQQAVLLGQIEEMEQRGPAFIPMTDEGINEMNEQRDALYRQLREVGAGIESL
jgi:hypothetical protein